MTLQVSCGKNKRTETGVISDEISFGKIDKKLNLILFGSGYCPT